MPPEPTNKWIARAWAPEPLRRMARGFQEVALAELTQSGAGAVRAPDFHRQAQALLRRRGGDAAALPALRAVARAGLRINHPCAMAQQIAAPIPMAALVESAVAALNQSIAVWDMSPAGTLVDREVLRRFKKLLGYPAGAEGSLVPGGSFANLTALLAARAALDPAAWARGSGGRGRIAILAGAHTHYSIARAAGIMGLGADCVFPIALDAEHRTDPDRVAAAARTAHRAGYRKFIVVATSGSTPTGSCDDLAAMGAAARALGAKFETWFHVDACHGGGMLFSPKLRRRLRGIAAADSVAFDPHKMMFMPLAAGAVLVRRGEHLRQAFEQHAPYLFTPVRKAVADVGPFTIACSQRFDALKIWLVWRAYGPGMFAALAESVCATAAAAHAYCLQSKILEPVHRPQSNIFCFRLRGRGDDRRHWALKEAVNAGGRAYLSSTVLDGARCLRLVVMNPRSRPAHAARVLRAVERAAAAGGRS